MSPFSPLKYPLCLAMPEHLSDVESWHEHIPFAFALMAVARPRVLVELGTHKGDSYCAFCQAIKTLELDTRCHAVDTWLGDEQAGVFGDEVLEELREYHDSRYGSFSSLMRMKFDEALPDFADGSIDVLHIDGLHTEAAVRHDFTSWLPKMSDRGVILFHDTRVFREDFGVWKVWQDCAKSYPNFEFSHGNGLGVLAVGKQAPDEVRELCDLGAVERDTSAMLFQALGSRIRLARHDKLLRTQIDELWKRTRQAEAAGEKLREEGEKLREEIVASQQRFEREIAALDQRYRTSHSWRITAPLRRLAALAKRNR